MANGNQVLPKSLHSDLRKGTVAEWIKALLLREKMYKIQNIQRVKLIESQLIELQVDSLTSLKHCDIFG